MKKHKKIIISVFLILIIYTCVCFYLSYKVTMVINKANQMSNYSEELLYYVAKDDFEKIKTKPTHTLSYENILNEEYDIRYLYTIWCFNKAYYTINYSYSVFDNNGKTLYGCSGISKKITLILESGKWKIANIQEKP